VTVCIAAIAEGETQICVATDSKAAFGDFSSDKGAIKHEHLGNGHMILIAGNDIVYALTLIAKAKKRIEKEQIRDTDATAEVIYEEVSGVNYSFPSTTTRFPYSRLNFFLSFSQLSLLLAGT